MSQMIAHKNAHHGKLRTPKTICPPTEKRQRRGEREREMYSLNWQSSAPLLVCSHVSSKEGQIEGIDIDCHTQKSHVTRTSKVHAA